MYPFESVAWAWDELWAAVHDRAPWTPSKLTRSGDVHGRWYDPDCVVTQVCGWPLAALHRHDMNVIGAFSLDLPEADDDARYRSVLLSPHERSLASLVDPQTRVVANSADSLSGWFSLLANTVGSGNDWPGPTYFTRSHHDSIRELSRGDADLASIDSWSLALITDQEPELVASLHRVGYGPRIPTPALTARKTINADQLAELRAAFSLAVSDPHVESALRSLRISGFVPAELDRYLATLPLGPTPSE